MKRNAVFWAIVLIGLGVLLILRDSVPRWKDVSLGSLVLIALGMWLLVQRPWFGWWGGGFIVPAIMLGLGIALLLQDLDVIGQDFSLWPIVLIAVGAAILFGSIGTARPVASTEETIPLEDATSARVSVNHGAGRLIVGPTEQEGILLNGTFAGGVEAAVRRADDRLDVSLRQHSRGSSWPRSGHGFEWAMSLTKSVPLSLEFHTGASESRLELADLLVADLELQTGASQTDVTMPARGRTTARVRAGAAKVRIKIPDGVAASIRTRKGLATTSIDSRRFPLSGDRYVSADYDGAESRVDLDIEAGAADISVR
jgi:hypothetical protein